MDRVVVLSIAGDDPASLGAVLSGNVDGADVVELRADRMRTDAVIEAIRRCPRPVIVTARSTREGGAWDRGEDDRRGLYVAALDAGALAVDVELGSSLATRLGDAAGTGIDPARVVLSFHGGSCDLGRMRELIRRLLARPARWLKLVPHAESVDDVRFVRDLLAEVAPQRRRVACFATGHAGAPSRILCLSWGSWGTYASLRAGCETAAGQVSARDLVGVFRVREISPRTRIYGLVGRPVAGSPSPAMHADAYARAGLDARYIPIETDDLDAFERLRPHVPLEAVGVTRPHKEAAARRCRALDELAARTGAVNTVRFDGSDWSGWNTDASALRAVVSSRLDVRDRRAIVVGAGGTGATAAWSLARLGARVCVVNRTEHRARALADRLGVDVAPWDELGRLRGDVWVQTTPDDRIALPLRASRARVLIDYVYSDRATTAVETAEASGTETVDGLDLLAAQGVDQFRWMTGAAADVGRMREAASSWLRARGGDPAPGRAPG